METDRAVLGIDLNDEYAQVSIYKMNMEEPASVSAVTGGDKYLIPAVVSKRQGLGQWFYGEEALKSPNGLRCDRLLSRGIRRENVYIEKKEYRAEELLTLFIQKLIILGVHAGFERKQDVIALTLKDPEDEEIALLKQVLMKLGMREEQVRIMSHEDVFAHYCLAQEQALYQHSSLLFEMNQDRLLFMECRVNRNMMPMTVEVQSEELEEFGEMLEMKKDATKEERLCIRDEAFLNILNERFEKRIISAVYLIGDGFDGEWMKKSTAKLVSGGRRAFMGKNLYTKGACYGGKSNAGREYLILNEHIVRCNLSVRAKKNGEYGYLSLLEAGRNWQESSGSMNLILEGETELVITRTMLEGEELEDAVVSLETLGLKQIAKNRIEISVKAVSATWAEITITDLGFGQMIPATGNRITDVIELE